MKHINYPVILRILISAAFSLFVVKVTELLLAQFQLSLFLSCFCFLYLFWELHYRLLNHKFTVEKKPIWVFRFFVLVFFSIVFFVFVFLIIQSYLPSLLITEVLVLLFLFFCAITMTHLLMMSLQELKARKLQQISERSLVLEEKYKSIKSKTILHFLQNSLEATQRLITLDPQKADQQIEALTAMLRSLLQSRDKDYISLKEESDLVKEFVKLLELQGNVKIMFSIEEDPEHQSYQIPPFVLILIFDNVFLNRSFIPFAELEVYVENGIYLVAKYLQLSKERVLLKQDELLKNLKQRYSFTKQDTNVVMISTLTHTYIKVPLRKP